MLDKVMDGLRRTPLFTAGINVARRILPASVLTWTRSQMVRSLKGTPSEVFSEIHRRNIWGFRETASGAGSTLEYTEGLRQSLPGLIGELGIRTLLDLPCGDLHWISRIELPIERYIGGDIVADLVELAKSRYSRDDREFHLVDLCNDPLPDADLLFCRDCLIHLSEEMNLLAIANILRSNIRYLLTTTYPDGKNRSIVNGDWFTLNLCAAPYHFPPPIRTLDDWVPAYPRRQLALWEVETLRQACGHLLQERPSAPPREETRAA